MAFKLFLTLAILTLVRADLDDTCTCNKEQIESEREAVWELTDRVKGANSLPVLPAVIGPLVPCGNCLNYDRKKRMVLPENKDQEAKIVRVGVKDRRCPKNYVRIAYMCIPVDYWDE